MTVTQPPKTVPVVKSSAPTAVIRPGVHLTKREVFDACQALADADRELVAAGATDVSRALGDLFEMLEDRMTRG